MYLFIVGKSFQIISFYAFICFLHIKKNPPPLFMATVIMNQVKQFGIGQIFYFCLRYKPNMSHIGIK